MDANMSDLIGGVLSNPEALNKIKTLMPLVSQMMQAEPEAPAAPQAPPARQGAAADGDVAAAMQTIMAALSQAAPGAPPPAEPAAAEGADAPDGPADPGVDKALAALQNVTAAANPESDHRAKLLLSLKPFLKDSRQTKIDTAIKYINAAKLLSSFGGAKS